MKRLFSVFLMFLMLLSIAYAEIDYASMTVEELAEVISRAKNEILLREPVEDSDVLYDRNGIRMTIDHVAWPQSGDIYIYPLIINNSENDTVIDAEKVLVDGWVVMGGSGAGLNVPAQSKSKTGYIVISHIFDNTDIKSFDEIGSISLRARIMVNGKPVYVNYMMIKDQDRLKILTREYED